MLLTWPVHGVIAVFQEVMRQAEEAMYDEAALQAELKLPYQRLQAGELTEEAFELRENELAEQLAAAAEYNQHKRQMAQ